MNRIGKRLDAAGELRGVGHKNTVLVAAGKHAVVQVAEEARVREAHSGIHDVGQAYK